jgi:uncharacterized repeat protein (TIGR01451 family)
MEHHVTRIRRQVLFGIVLSGLAAGCLDDGSDDRGDQAEVESSITRGTTRTFASGALIIPLDTHAAAADELPGYGLVYELIRNNVPVQWAIRTGKAATGSDIEITAPAAVHDIRTGAAIGLPAAYRGGPFVIDAGDRPAATPIIQAWQATHPVTVVHAVTGAFTADIARTLTAAPRIAVLDDGNADIAIAAFRAAGIPDSNGDGWPAGSPDVLSRAGVAGATSSHTDGSLWNADGTPRYCYLASMHYEDASTTPAITREVVAEVRGWLEAVPANHAFMQCEAAVTFEDNVNGRFLSTGGIRDDGAPPDSLTDHAPDDPLTQAHGTLEAVQGLVDSIGLSPGSALRPGVQVLVNRTGAAPNTRMWLMTGRLDGDDASGRVTYLAGHDYLAPDARPAGPRPDGVKVMLNGLLQSGCATPTGGQPAITLTKTAPASITGDQITYTIHYANTGTGVANGATITDALPAGTTFTRATSGGTSAAGTVTWAIGNLAPGASGDVTVTVGVTADGAYTNQAVVRFQVGVSTKMVTSNPATTTRATRPAAVPAVDDLGVSGGGCNTGGGGLGLGALAAAAALALLRRRRGGAAAVLVAAVLPRVAGAQVMEPANFGVERFQLSSDRDGLFDVEWAEVRGDMAISAALWAGLANDPLVLYRGQPGARVGSLVADRAGGGLGASISPNRWLQLGFDLPLVIYQDRPGASALGAMESLRSFGIGNMRVIPKLVVLHQADHGVSLAVIPTVILPTRSTGDSYVGDGGLGFAPELALSRRWTGWRASIDAGYHARRRSTFLNQVVDDELFARAGLGYQLADRAGPPVGIDLTMSGATAARAPLQTFNENHLEGLVGATYDLTGDAQLFAGAGVGLRKGYGTPDWRGLVGVRMGFGSVHRTPVSVPPAPDCRDVPGLPRRAGCPVPPIPVPPAPDCRDVPGLPRRAGCPVPPIEIGEVYFEFDRAEIEPDSVAVLDQVVAAFRADDQLKLEVEGHADSQGDDAYNKQLSQRRADAVLAYLAGKGIAADRLTTLGVGEGRPLADNSTPDGRAHNRCVAFRILGGGDHVKIDVPGAAGDAK